MKKLLFALFAVVLIAGISTPAFEDCNVITENEYCGNTGGYNELTLIGSSCGDEWGECYDACVESNDYFDPPVEWADKNGMIIDCVCGMYCAAPGP